ncbi:MAG: IPT/TIG domain-containing protein [Polyangiales bacterium]
MTKLAGILGAVIGVVLLASACEKPRPEMSFERLDPDFGGLQGGKTVQIIGQHVRLDIGYAVYFGKLRSPEVSMQSENAISAVTPQQTSPGVVDVTIRADNGSVFVIKRGFEYVNQGGNLLDGPEAR